MLHKFPQEILTQVIDQPGEQRDFQTLFACAVTCKRLASVALPCLYRIHTDCVAFGRKDHIREGFGCPRIIRGDDDPDSEVYEEYIKYTHLRYFSRRMRLWKSIIFSSVGITAYPYCLYIKSLNLNLKDIRKYAIFCDEEDIDFFWDAEIAKLVTFSDSDTNQSNWRFDDICIPETSELITESLLSHICEHARHSGSTVNLEHLALYHDDKTLTRWISKLSRLKSLVISTRNLGNSKDLAKEISEKCPEFQNLRVVVNSDMEDEKEDKILAQFLRGLRQNTLRKFITSANKSDRHLTSHFSIGLEALLSLNHHAESLTTLKFCHLEYDLAPKLNELSCKGLTSIQFLSSLPICDEFIDWICNNRGLCELSLGLLGFENLGILAEVCSKPWIQLQKIEVECFGSFSDDHLFKPLLTQRSLEYLRLRGSIKNCLKESESCICDLSCFEKLKVLDITANEADDENCFGDYDESTISYLISNLHELEELTFSCHYATDGIWDELGKLRHLRVLNIEGSSNFSCEGILAYIDALHETNRGLELSIVITELISYPGESTFFDCEQRASIRKAIQDKVGGSFRMESLEK